MRNFIGVSIVVAVVVVLVSVTVQVRGQFYGHRVLTVREGLQAELPCNIHNGTSISSSHLLSVWWVHLNSSPNRLSPFYTVIFDPSKNNLNQGNRIVRDDWADRAYFFLNHPATLKVNKVRFEDNGTYVCILRYKERRTRNITLELRVVAPPEAPVIKDRLGRILQKTAGPYNEGELLFLMCDVEGGRPAPHITWTKNGQLMATNVTSVKKDLTRATLTMIPRREDLNALLECDSANNVSEPMKESLNLDLYLNPIKAEIRGNHAPIAAGLPTEVNCEVWGSRPRPEVTWWLGHKQLRHAFEHVSANGSVLTSVVAFTPTSEDNGQSITCSAKNPHLNTKTVRDSWILKVFYKPNLIVRLGKNLVSNHIQEHMDIYLECLVDASPKANNVTWQFNGKAVTGSLEVKVVMDHLAIQDVQLKHSGNYTCSAVNAQGTGLSPPLMLKVRHAPICRNDQTVTYRLSPSQEVNIVCDVQANPEGVTFEWRFNDTGGHHSRTMEAFTWNRTRSIMRYMVQSPNDYGTLECLAKNRVGLQSLPCLFHILPSKPPTPLENCTLRDANGGLSFQLDCHKSSTDHTQELYYLIAYEGVGAEQVANLSSNVPEFTFRNRRRGKSYLFEIYASNDRGQSPKVRLVFPEGFKPGSLKNKGPKLQFSYESLKAMFISILIVILVLPLIIFIAFRFRRRKTCQKKHREKQLQIAATVAPAELQALNLPSPYKIEHDFWSRRETVT